MASDRRLHLAAAVIGASAAALVTLGLRALAPFSGTQMDARAALARLRAPRAGSGAGRPAACAAAGVSGFPADLALWSPAVGRCPGRGCARRSCGRSSRRACRPGRCSRRPPGCSCPHSRSGWHSRRSLPGTRAAGADPSAATLGSGRDRARSGLGGGIGRARTARTTSRHQPVAAALCPPADRHSVARAISTATATRNALRTGLHPARTHSSGRGAVAGTRGACRARVRPAPRRGERKPGPACPRPRRGALPARGWHDRQRRGPGHGVPPSSGARRRCGSPLSSSPPRPGPSCSACAAGRWPCSSPARVGQ